MLRISALKRQGFKNFVWRYDGVLTVAKTKSEARAKFKNIFSLGRLPAGAVVELGRGVNE